MAKDSESQFIALCISQIEEKYEHTLPTPWRQRELEHFQHDLQESTGIRLSISTLKRLWKQDFNQIPHPATLDALGQFLGYDRWHDFKDQQPSPYTKNRISRPVPLLLSAAVIVIGVGIVLLINVAFSPSPSPIRMNGPVTFEVDKTVSKGVPNTIMYRYEVSKVEADSFFIQQSWNELQRQPIAPPEGVFASIYYIPGFHRGKLIANDSIIAKRRVHILTDGWMCYARYDYQNPIPVYLESANEQGVLSAGKAELLEKTSDRTKDWTITYTNIADFQANSDGFELSATLKLAEPAEDGCGYMEMRILTEEHIFYIPLTSKGCVAGLYLKLGEKVLRGQTEDLSAFGTDVLVWNRLRLLVKNKVASVYLDGQMIKTLSFEQSFGNIKGLAFRFSDRGLVDDVMLKDQSGSVVYADEFSEVKPALVP